MRIISGALAGREIWTPQVSGTRPAMGRTREALFSMLEARSLEWDGISVLDLFAGTGSLAFEALSRGAAIATLVDNSETLIKSMGRNTANFGMEARCHLVKQDVLRFLSRTPARQYQLVFVDPPYRHNYATPVLERLAGKGWLAADAFIIGELENGADVRMPLGFETLVERVFGQTILKIWKYNEDRSLSGNL